MPTTTSYVAEADSNTNWDERVKLYAKAEQVLIDEAMIVPLVHPVTMAVISDKLGGDGSTPNALGFTPLDRLGHYFFTHLSKK